MDFPGVTVGIVQSRTQWIEDALACVNGQVYPGDIEIVVIDNLNNEKSIGQAFNEIVDKASHPWIFYLGDDDKIKADYLVSMMAAAQKAPDATVIASNCTMFDDERRELSQKIVTSFWRTEYLREHPWNEDIEKYIDTYQFKKANENGALIAHNSWNYGYYYRQHDSNVSGNKFQKSTYPVQIYGHKRSGNHYLGCLIDANFTKTGNPIDLLAGHDFLSEIDVDTKYLYIKRNFEDVAKSLYEYRDRQSLKADSFEEFLATEYSEMFDPTITCTIDYDMGTEAANAFMTEHGNTTEPVGYFKDINMTPETFHTLHVKHFEQAEKLFTNVQIVDYEDLLENFESTMDMIADFLGYPQGGYTNITKKVGWWNVSD